MRRFFTAVARIIAVLISMLFVATSVVVIVANCAEHQLTSVATYRAVLARPGLFEETMPDLIVSTVRKQSFPDEGPAEALSHLTDEDLRAIIEEVAPADWVRGEATRLVSAVFDWLNSDEPRPQLTVSISEVKARLVGEPGRRAIERVVQTWPACDQERLAELLAGGQEGFPPVCNPPDALRPVSVRLIQGSLPSALNSVPDTLDPFPTGGRDGHDPISGLLSFRDSLRRVRDLLRISVLVPLALLLLVTLFAVRSLRGLFGWWGALLLVVGLLVLTGTMVGPALTDLAISRLQLGVEDLPAGVASVLGDAVRTVIFRIAVQIRGVSLITAAAGLVFAVVAAAIPRRTAARGPAE